MKKLTAINKNIFYGILLCTLTIMGCRKSEVPAEKSVSQGEEHHSEMEVELNEEQFKVAEIKLGKAEEKPLSETLQVNGVLGVPPQNLVSISAPYGGFVKSTKLLHGTKVQKGEVLVVMEHPDYVQLQQDYIDKKGMLEYLEQEYRRQEELQKNNVNAAKQFQQAKSQYTTIKAQVKGLQEKLSIIGVDAKNLTENNISSTIQIHSPISGYISAVNVNIGKYVNPTDVMFEIINTEHLHVELTVYEKDIAKIKIGQKVKFYLPNKGSKEHEASVYLIGRKIEEGRSVRVHAHLEEEDKELLPGMFVNAKIELEKNNTQTLPQEAIVFFEGKHYVFVLEGREDKKYHFKMTEVETGTSESGYTEVHFLGDKISPKQIAVKGAHSLFAALKNTEDEGGHGH